MKKNRRRKSTTAESNDRLAQSAYDLLDSLAAKNPHIKDAVRSARSTESKLKNLEDNLVNTFTDGLNRLWEKDE